MTVAAVTVATKIVPGWGGTALARFPGERAAVSMQLSPTKHVHFIQQESDLEAGFTDTVYECQGLRGCIYLFKLT